MFKEGSGEVEGGGLRLGLEERIVLAGEGHASAQFGGQRERISGISMITESGSSATGLLRV